MTNHTEPLDLGPRQVARSRVINAPAATLYRVLENPHRHHEIDGSATVGPRVNGPQRLTAGDSFSVGMRLGPIRYRMRNTVTETGQDRIIEWRLPAGHRWRWELAPVPAGGTRVTEVFDYRESRAPWLLELLGFPHRNGLGIERTLEQLDSRLLPAGATSH